MEINAAVFRKVHEPLTIEAVEIDKPWGREVLVRTAATGVCHSDLHVVDGVGRFPLDRPIVLGHEGAGVVEAVGATGGTVDSERAEEEMGDLLFAGEELLESRIVADRIPDGIDLQPLNGSVKTSRHGEQSL